MLMAIISQVELYKALEDKYTQCSIGLAQSSIVPNMSTWQWGSNFRCRVPGHSTMTWPQCYGHITAPNHFSQ